MSRPGNSDTANSTGPAARPAAVSAPRPRDRRDPRLSTGSDVADAVPLAGQPGHGSAAFLRNQPARIVDGQIHGGYNGVYELICPNCGDDPDLDYLQVAPPIQWLRGPRPIAEGLAAYHQHLGKPWAEKGRAGSSGPGEATAGQGPVLEPVRELAPVRVIENTFDDAGGKGWQGWRGVSVRELPERGPDDRGLWRPATHQGPRNLRVLRRCRAGAVPAGSAAVPGSRGTRQT